MESFYIEAESLKDYDNPNWQQYRLWNQIFSDYFFSGRYKNKPLRLDISEDLTSAIGRELKIKDEDVSEGLIQVVRNTLSESYSPFYDHLKIAINWRNLKKAETPPFILVLCFFSFVAERMIEDSEFVAIDYYGRLAKDLGCESTQKKQRLMRSYQELCDICWNDLNEWLDSWGGELGFSTAKSLDRRKYVSIAISQALIRDQDREILHRIFEEKGLSPKQRISSNQMMSILNDWASGHSGNLVNLLKKESIKNQVVEAACYELESWEGLADRPEGQIKTSKLFYLLSFNDYGAPKVNLRICTYLNNYDNKKFKLITEDVMSDDSASAFKEVKDRVQFRELDNFNYYALEPNDIFPHSEALQSDIKLFSEDGNQFLKREGKYICVFEYNAEISAYTEKPNIDVGQKNIVLVHQKLSEKVNLFLKKTARPGFKFYSSKDVKNLPENWSIFSDVQILISMNELGLEMLSPLFIENTINLSDGLYLGKNTYLTSVPPTINVVTDIFTPVRLIINQSYAYQRKIDPIEIVIEDCVKFIDTKLLNLTDGDYELAIESDKTLSESSFKLRSSSNTKLYKSLNNSSLAYKFFSDDYFFSISAIKINTENESNFARGGYIVTQQNNNIETIPFKNSTPHLNLSSDEENQIKLNLKSYTKNLNTCNLTGEHEWELLGRNSWEIANINDLKENQPIIHKKYGIGRFAGLRKHANGEVCIHLRFKYRQPFDVSIGNKDLLYKYTDGPEEFAPLHIGPNEGGKKEWEKYQSDQLLPQIWDGTIVEVKCKKCNSTSWKNHNFNKKKIEPVKSHISLIDVEKVNEKQNSISLNNIFEALSYLKSESFERFCSVVREFDDSPWYPYNFLRQLSSLGHLDVEFDRNSLKPVNWRISDPTLIKIGPKKFKLLGWRSKEFVELLKKETDNLGGGHVIIKQNKTFIDDVYIEDVEFEDLNAFASIISETSTFPLFISDNFCDKLLTCLPKLSSLLVSLPVLALPDNDLDYYDIKQHKWVPIKANYLAGAYQYKIYGNKYFYLPQAKNISNNCFLCDAKLVKYLALKDSHDNWFTYNKETETLNVAKHMELPYLYERVAVCFSGELPETSDYLSYRNIPEKLAEGLAYKLFN